MRANAFLRRRIEAIHHLLIVILGYNLTEKLKTKYDTNAPTQFTTRKRQAAKPSRTKRKLNESCPNLIRTKCFPSYNLYDIFYGYFERRREKKNVLAFSWNSNFPEKMSRILMVVRYVCYVRLTSTTEISHSHYFWEFFTYFPSIFFFASLSISNVWKMNKTKIE